MALTYFWCLISEFHPSQFSVGPPDDDTETPVPQVLQMNRVIQVVQVLQRFRCYRYSCVVEAQGIPGAQEVPHDLGLLGVAGATPGTPETRCSGS